VKLTKFSLLIYLFSQLINEIGKFDEDQMGDGNDTQGSLRRVKDYRKTSMNKGVVIFEEFVRKLEDTWKGKHIKIEASGKCEILRNISPFPPIYSRQIKFFASCFRCNTEVLTSPLDYKFPQHLSYIS